MIEIKLLDQPDIVENLCRENGVEYTSEMLAYHMSEGGNPTGLCLFTYREKEKTGNLIFVSAREEGLLLADGLIRSGVSLLYDRGVRKVTAEKNLIPSAPEKAAALLLKRMGFSQTDAGWELSVTENFFKGCCGEK